MSSEGRIITNDLAAAHLDPEVFARATELRQNLRAWATAPVDPSVQDYAVINVMADEPGNVYIVVVALVGPADSTKPFTIASLAQTTRAAVSRLANLMPPGALVP